MFFLRTLEEQVKIEPRFFGRDLEVRKGKLARLCPPLSLFPVLQLGKGAGDGFMRGSCVLRFARTARGPPTRGGAENSMCAAQCLDVCATTCSLLGRPCPPLLLP